MLPTESKMERLQGALPEEEFPKSEAVRVNGTAAWGAARPQANAAVLGTGIGEPAQLMHLVSLTPAAVNGRPFTGFLPLVPPKPCISIFHPRQEWGGRVVLIEDDHFVAKLANLTAGHSHESAEATIPLAAISEHDASRIEIGSAFNWMIGCEYSAKGERKEESQIVFRQFPGITEEDMEEARKWADETLAIICP